MTNGRAGIDFCLSNGTCLKVSSFQTGWGARPLNISSMYCAWSWLLQKRNRNLGIR